MGLPVSVCIIVENEENNIERCLKSFAGLDFEIVVVDTGQQTGRRKTHRNTPIIYMIMFGVMISVLRGIIHFTRRQTTGYL